MSSSGFEWGAYRWESSDLLEGKNSAEGKKEGMIS